jgi:hypothetical protein
MMHVLSGLDRLVAGVRLGLTTSPLGERLLVLNSLYFNNLPHGVRCNWHD